MKSQPSAAEVGRSDHAASAHLLHRWLLLACVVGALVACTLSAAIAIRSAPNAHPDEVIHGDAFCYFQRHDWPPPLNSNGLEYSPDGMSRVYTGEIVYIIGGKIGALVSPLSALLGAKTELLAGYLQPKPANIQTGLFLPLIVTKVACLYDLRTYRLLNTLLLAATLFVLLYASRHHPWPLMIAAVLLCLPQVVYVYSYANSDAWGLSMSLFLFTFAVTRPQPLAALGSTLLLAVLTALVILSKEPFWIALPFSYLWIVFNSWSHRSPNRRPCLRAVTGRHVVLLAAIVILSAIPFRVLPSLNVPDYQQQVEQMREARAWEEYKPSTLTAPGFRLATKGTPFHAVLLRPEWVRTSLASLYGMFGHLTVSLPATHYWLVGGLTLLFIGLTYWFGVTHRRSVADAVILALWASPVFIGVNVLASVYNSWTYDFQPQGRYLFPSLAPLALIVAVTFPYEPRWSQVLRFGGWLFACALCLLTLYHYVLVNPQLLPL